MHDDVKETFRGAIMRTGAALQQHVGHFTEPVLVWRKQPGKGQWLGETQQRPSLSSIFVTARQQIHEVSADFLRAFLLHHPEYAGMMGFSGLGRLNLLHIPGFILDQTMSTLWTRHGTFQPESGAVEALIQEFSEFIDQPHVRFRFTAPLLNCQMDIDHVPLPDGLAIRRLSEQEVSAIHGGPIVRPGFTPRGIRVHHECAVEGEFEEPKVFGDADDGPDLPGGVRERLDKAVLALRTFKEGRVGYDSIRFQCVGFCPIPLQSLEYGDLHVPIGRYAIVAEDMEPLRKHAEMIFKCDESSMKMACSRLADSQIRLRPEDRLVDAVIGLESLLLGGLRNEDRRGELKFRFSLHYSTLFGTPEERYRAFRLAKDLYDLRCVIAHGTEPSNDCCRVGDKQLSLQDASLRACEVLRDLIRHFLPCVAATSYKQPQFWERAYFGLSLETPAARGERSGDNGN